jgi:hypothetical protein
MSWQRTKLGFAALERLYSSTNEQRNKMAFLATREEDQEFTQQMFARIGNDWNSAVWGLKEKFDAARLKLHRRTEGSRRAVLVTAASQKEQQPSCAPLRLR